MRALRGEGVYSLTFYILIHRRFDPQPSKKVCIIQKLHGYARD
jgi:hypothetical protein